MKQKKTKKNLQETMRIIKDKLRWNNRSLASAPVKERKIKVVKKNEIIKQSKKQINKKWNKSKKSIKFVVSLNAMPEEYSHNYNKILAVIFLILYLNSFYLSRGSLARPCVRMR